ncbi:error-prone DNA polymerase [Spartobacteria bacterium LR76]|nr:error-prone DNA polymerase [Spartobacteria bacterium LR76]
MSGYVELHARSALSFLGGASRPEELSKQAAKLALPAMALCDRDGLYGAARHHVAAKDTGIEPLIGAELTMEDGSILPVLVATREGYRNLSRLITEAKLRGTKTECAVRWGELPAYAAGLLALTGEIDGILQHRAGRASEDRLEKVLAAFGQGNVYVEVQRHLLRGEERRQQYLEAVAARRHLPIVATNGVMYHDPARRGVQDVFTCIRHHTSLCKAGRVLSANGERFLKGPEQMRRLFADHPEYLDNTLRVAERLEFRLADLGYEFPKYPVPEGETMEAFLRRTTMEGARRLYGSGLSEKVRRQLEFELDLICRLGFAGYFLIVWDLVNYCRDHDILVQGRGSAANSAVCYSLGITVCDPVGANLLFERFLSEGRTSWPDIDLDLPSGTRREQVIQEVYQRYGKHGAAMTANVITYRGRSAMREIGKALEFSESTLKRFSSLFANGDFPHTLDLESQLERSGVGRDNPHARTAAMLYEQMYGLPRHLGQHSGGMIICQGALSSVVPLENASMPGRVVAQWDKDDCEDMGIIKVDLLGLGMMSAMQDTLAICTKRGRPVDLAHLPKDDPGVYDLLQRADTIGTFQVESRAQMATLPRLKPQTFYDIVVQVAIIRPGPIQGNMVNPFLARKAGEEEVTYIDPKLKPVLERTLGVPLFQEQLLKIAMVMADFSGSEAEELRRALSFHRSQERMDKVCVKLRTALEHKGVKPDVRDQLIQAVQSFAVYGFPESHAISFATIAYASCWLKVHRAPEFYCGLLNNMPMGFYSENTLLQDARQRGVRVRPISVLESDWLCRVDEEGALRLGLCMVRGVSADAGQRIASENARARFTSLKDLRIRTQPGTPALRILARIGALNGLVAHRRDGLWKIEAPFSPDELPLFEEAESSPLEAMSPEERLTMDFADTRVTTGPHPMQLLRGQIPDAVPAADLPVCPANEEVEIAGMVICRQRPGTGKGVVFVSLEDETGIANAILHAAFFEKHRLVVTQERFLRIRGKLQRHKGVIHVLASAVEKLAARPPEVAASSHDFH